MPVGMYLLHYQVARSAQGRRCLEHGTRALRRKPGEHDLADHLCTLPTRLRLESGFCTASASPDRLGEGDQDEISYLTSDFGTGKGTYARTSAHAGKHGEPRGADFE